MTTDAKPRKRRGLNETRYVPLSVRIHPQTKAALEALNPTSLTAEVERRLERSLAHDDALRAVTGLDLFELSELIRRYKAVRDALVAEGGDPAMWFAFMNHAGPGVPAEHVRLTIRQALDTYVQLWEAQGITPSEPTAYPTREAGLEAAGHRLTARRAQAIKDNREKIAAESGDR